jgi:DNA uptake protein ComE-like DNA-binding protein
MPPVRRLALFLLALIASATAQDLKEIGPCRFIPTPWADGDSFLVETPEGKQMTVRLYGADCIEWHVTDDSDARRLREQRRYFGISGPAGQAAASIQLAKDFGKAAAEETARALAKPFTIQTTFADARGDGKYKRVYAFVTTAEGEDLSARLVKHGLARAFGVYRATADGVSKAELIERFDDLELQAARLGKGVWAKTDWNALPEQRKLQREEDAEFAEAKGGAKLTKGETIDLNSAARDELMRLPGVGEKTANRIIEGRPYRSVADLGRVDGIGEATLKRLKPHLTIGKVP